MYTDTCICVMIRCTLETSTITHCLDTIINILREQDVVFTKYDVSVVVSPQGVALTALFDHLLSFIIVRSTFSCR